MTDPIVDPALEAAYLTDQRRPTWPALIAEFEAASAAVAARPDFQADLPYGPHPRQRFDLLPADGPARATLVYLHPGWWQSRDKSLFRFLAPFFAALGCDVALANYPLCPDATVAELTEAARAVVPVVAERAARVHGRTLPIVAGGHSAGGHLAVELAMTDWAARGLAPDAITGVFGLSGAYDLRPLVATTLNLNLRLDAAAAAAATPLLRVGARGCPGLFAVGGGETPDFHGQTRRMADAWTAAGHDARALISRDDDHFTILTTLLDPTSPLHAAVSETIDRAAGSPRSER